MVHRTLFSFVFIRYTKCFIFSQALFFLDFIPENNRKLKSIDDFQGVHSIHMSKIEAVVDILLNTVIVCSYIEENIIVISFWNFIIV